MLLIQDLYEWYGVPVVTPIFERDKTVIKDDKWDAGQMSIRTWIVSKLDTSSDEQNGLAARPSGASRQITKIFQQLGMTPVVETSFRDQRDIFFYCGNQSMPAFDPAGIFWTFNCNRTSNDRYGMYRKGKVTH